MSVPVRDAATVMLVRDAVDEAGAPAVEVCMLRRNLEAEFVAGAYVFPGGSVDEADRSPGVEAWCRGRTDAEASAVLGVPSGGLGFWVAALRECFEEAGVLVAHPRGHPDGDALLDTSDPATAARFADYRDRVNARSLRLLDLCRAEDLELVVDDVHYVSHWITPALAPKRYDTRFFVTTAPTEQVALHDGGETIATIWVRPDDMLGRFRRGELELLPPTVVNLEALGRFDSTAAVRAWASTVTDVPTVLPVVTVAEGRFVVLHPGDVGYEEAAAGSLGATG
jgi:8-oxo-dGTP pyrophosphatase MutT (NUDIX family)